MAYPVWFPVPQAGQNIFRAARQNPPAPARQDDDDDLGQGGIQIPAFTFPRPLRPTVQDLGLATGGAINNLLLQGFSNFGPNLQNSLNRAYDQFQFYADRGANRRLLASLLGNALGLGGRMTGFRDAATGQEANIGGLNRSSINVNPLSANQIAGGVGTVSSIPRAPTSAPRGVNMGSGALSRQFGNLARTAASRNALDVEGGILNRNAQLARAIELAQARQGIGNARLGTELYGDLARTRSGLLSPLAGGLWRSLMG